MDDSDPSQGLYCGVCYEKYDLKTHLPRILPHCGHTLCSKCIKEIMGSTRRSTFTCPFDKTDVPFPVNSLNQFPPNFQLKTVIEARPSQVDCQEHGKPLHYVCLTHDARICGDCILFGDHKNSKDHNIQAFNKIKLFYIERKEYLENIKKEIHSFHPDVEHFKKALKDQKDRSKITVCQFFKKVKAFIEAEENKQLLAVDNFFEDRIRDAEKKSQEHEDLKREIDKRVDEHQRMNSREGPVKTLAEDVWQFSGKLEALKKTFGQSSSGDSFKDFLEKFKLSLATQLSEVYSFKFDPNQIFKDIAAEAKMSTFEQAETLALRDFDVVLKTFGLTDECKNQAFLSKLISNPVPKRIEALKSLNRVCVSSKNPRIFTHKMMDKLKNVRVFLRNIQNSCICLDHPLGNNVNEQVVQDFLQILFWNPLSITQICLRFCTSAITDSTIQFLANKIFPRALNLQHVYIDFDQKNLTSQSIEILLRGLIPISTNLTSLEIDFSKLSSPHLGGMPYIEFSLPKLKKFNVKLCKATLSDSFFNSFLRNTIDSLTEIEDFCLDLSNTEITEQKASEIFPKILRVFLKCRQLQLGMPINHVSKSVVKNFMKQSLVRLERMEKIRVFGSYGEIQRGFDERAIESEDDELEFIIQEALRTMTIK